MDPNNTEDVTPDPSPGPEDQPVVQDAEQVPVSDQVPELKNDRPLENHIAEQNRKLGDLTRQVNDLMAILAAGSLQAQPAPAANPPAYTNEQLQELARAGSVEASLELQRRIAREEAQSIQTVNNQAQLVQSQLLALYTRYPQLRNPADPLTVEAMKFKHVLVQSGKDPRSGETDLEAIKNAIVDNPKLAQGQPASQDYTRQQSARPQQSMDGSNPRRQPSGKAPGKKITDPKVLAIAARMGVDPDKAMANFEERQAKGRSSVSPMISMILREQG